jgi:hypothetical protein
LLLKLLVLLFEEGLRQGVVEVLKVLAEGAQAGGDGVVLHHHPFLGGGVQEVVVADNRAFDLLKIIKILTCLSVSSNVSLYSPRILFTKSSFLAVSLKILLHSSRSRLAFTNSLL